MKASSLLSGLAGALALNLLHEITRRFYHQAPRIDLIGEEALAKSLKAADVTPPTGDKLYASMLAADLVSNALYYSLIGTAKRKHTMLTASLMGLSAGIGAVVLPQPMGLDERPVNKSTQTRLLTIGYYVAGAWVTASVLSALKKPGRRKTKAVLTM